MVTNVWSLFCNTSWFLEWNTILIFFFQIRFVIVITCQAFKHTLITRYCDRYIVLLIGKYKHYVKKCMYILIEISQRNSIVAFLYEYLDRFFVRNLSCCSKKKKKIGWQSIKSYISFADSVSIYVFYGETCICGQIYLMSARRQGQARRARKKQMAQKRYVISGYRGS